MTEQPEVDALLERARRGDQAAWAQLFDFLYQDLRSMARSRFGSLIRGQTSPTGLVNEAVGKLLGSPGNMTDRVHFLRLNAAAMRQILTDRWRSSRTQRHASDNPVVRFPIGDGGFIEVPVTDADLDFYLEVDLAVEKLSACDRVAADVFSLRYWSGLTSEEVAKLLSLSAVEARAKWEFAKTFLGEALKDRRRGS